MIRYYDTDYSFFVYSVAEIKSELGITPQSRSGLFEKILVKLYNENKISVLDWILNQREYRMLTPSDVAIVVSEFYRLTPDKKKSKYANQVNSILSNINS